MTDPRAAPPIGIPQTATSLGEYLQRNAVDVAEMSLPAFRRWLQAQINRAAGRSLFRSRCRVREIERSHRRRLRNRGIRHAVAERAWQADEAFERHRRLSGRAESLQKAVEGLTAAVARDDADPVKLQRFADELGQTRDQLQRLVATNAAARRLHRATDSLHRLRVEIGLHDARAEVTEAASDRGTAATQSGSDFERLSAAAVADWWLPHFAARADPPVAAEDLIVLHGATLGCARGEFDHLIIDPTGGGQVVQVLAIVEAKRNVNDLPHGFRLRQENLAWLTGDRDAYDAEQYRTTEFPTGHFDRPVVHRRGNEELRFDRRSFWRFNRSVPNGPRIDGLCFVTEPRRLLGVSSAEWSKMMHHVATDERVRLTDDYQLRIGDRNLRKLRDHWRTDIAAIQAADVLMMYQTNDAAAYQIMFIPRQHRRGG